MITDFLNKRIGELLVVESLGKHIYNKNTGKKQEKFKCLCSCGEYCEYWRGQLKSKQVSKCRNPQNHLIKYPNEDLVGEKYGKLKVINFSHFDRSGPTKQYWNCLCECGNKKIILKNCLKSGDTKSCGCLEKANRLRINNEFTKKKTLPKNEAAINDAYYKYQINAKKRNIEFSLSRNEAEKLFYSKCQYCGIQNSRFACSETRKINGNPKINGIDRKDNELGYTVENCVPCCTNCNYAKRNMSEKDFLEWIKRIIKHNFKELDLLRNNINDI